MKIRYSFVTNSSSSSFLCEICGNHGESDTEDYGGEVVWCKNGHCFCGRHIDVVGDSDPRKFYIDDINHMIEYDQKGLNSEQLSSRNRDYYTNALKKQKLELERVHTLTKEDARYDDWVMASFWNYILEHRIPAENCPLCKLEQISDATLLKYLVKENNIDKEAIKQAIKDKFDGFKQLKEYLDGNKK